MERFWRKLKAYIVLPEMRLFWLFLPVIVAFFALSWIDIPGRLTEILTTAIFSLGAVIVFVSSMRLARSNLEVKVERNELWSIINNLRDGIIAYSTDFKILVFNNAAEAIFSMPASKVVGQAFPPKDSKDVAMMLLTQVMFPSLAPDAIVRSRPDDPIQIVDVSFENPRMEIRITTAKIIDPANKLLGFVKIVHDRTRELDVLRSKSEFVTVAAHQLRTPLNGITWALETIQHSKFNDQDRELVSSSLKAADKLLKIVNDLLDVAGIEGGRFGYHFETVELTGFIEKLLEEMAVVAEKYEVKVYFEKPAKNFTVTIDPARMSLAMNNILDNAVKYNTKNGEVTVKVAETPDSPYIKVSVTDSGLGIPPDDMKKMFSKFFRSQNAMRKETAGTGLGLYIARNIIMRHGGEIWLESELNRGTVVNFTIPTDPKLIPSKEIVYEEF